MDRLNVEVNLVELKQIFFSLWIDINDPWHIPAEQREEYRNNLTELANRLEKIMSDSGLEIRREGKFYILCNGGGW